MDESSVVDDDSTNRQALCLCVYIPKRGLLEVKWYMFVHMSCKYIPIYEYVHNIYYNISVTYVRPMLTSVHAWNLKSIFVCKIGMCVGICVECPLSI